MPGAVRPLDVSLSWPSERERLKSFARALDSLKKETEARMGEEDVRRVRRLHRLSRGCEGVGRVLIHVSPEPVTFFLGVAALFVHKQLQTTEIGHPVLHGCYDDLPDADRFHSRHFRWDCPIDEESWREGHNHRHHMYTNVNGKDPDIQFGPVRLTDQTPHRWYHYLQVPYTVLYMWPIFTAGMNAHFTGLFEVFRKEGRDEAEVLPDLSRASKRRAVRRAFRKYIPYYLKNYAFFPALAGPMFWKVLLGNWLAGTARDIYSAASIFCGHIGEDVDCYEFKAGPRGKGAWYERQVRATSNFEVPYVFSVLCGGLDYQIEHHLFPKVPPERLRSIAPEVRAICEAHGVPYRSASWGHILGQAFRHIWRLSFPQPAEAV